MTLNLDAVPWLISPIVGVLEDKRDALEKRLTHLQPGIIGMRATIDAIRHYLEVVDLLEEIRLLDQTAAKKAGAAAK